MPLKKYSKKSVRKSVKKFTRKPSMKRSSLVSLIKKVSLKPVETKHTHNIGENINLFHNVPEISYAHLNTTQSIADNNAGVSNFASRLGDEIILRGLSYKFWFANKLDRPNVMYKIVFFKYQSKAAPGSNAPFYSQGTANFMIRDLDTEQFKIIKVVNFNLQTNAQKIITIGGALVGAEGHRAISVYIPLKNYKCKYENGTTIPRFQDFAYTIIAYDSYGTATTDNIASYAVNRKLYFKDP